MATCPSSTCEPGAILLGVVGPDGRVRYVSPALTIDTAFVDSAKDGRPPERRFRFAGPCVEAECTQWSDGRCGVVDRILSPPRVAALAPDGHHVPHCAIRRTCRWFEQRGADACHACPVVITDSRAAEPTRSVNAGLDDALHSIR